MSEDGISLKNLRLPEPPDEPTADDCCGSGCIPCVFDIYDDELKKWKLQCQKLSEGGFDAVDGLENAISASEYRQFSILSITPVTKNTNIYKFGLPEGKVLKLTVGQHIVLRGCSDGIIIHRKYTLISPLKCTSFFEVLIKLYEDGKMSTFISTWKVGDLIEWRGPFGNFVYKANQYRHLGMLAAGTGIAPMVQVIREVVMNEEEDTFVHLVYACSTYEDILMKAFLDEMKQNWNFEVTFAISKEHLCDKTKVKYGDRVYYGRINKEVISQHMPKPQDGVMVLICGTRSFDKDMINYLQDIGYSHDMYYRF